MAHISRDMAMPRDNSPNLTGLPAVQASVTMKMTTQMTITMTPTKQDNNNDDD
jgi:hypothetical protein